MNIISELKTFGKNLTILIAEDDRELNEQLIELLRIFFKEVHFAYDGEKALEIFHQHHIDIVLSDITMPKMNGVDLSRELKNINRDQSIAILSAHSELDYLIPLIDIGIHQFVAKPFESQELLYRLLKIAENIVFKDAYYKYKNADGRSVGGIVKKNNLIQPIVESKTIDVKPQPQPILLEQAKLNQVISHERVHAHHFIEELQSDDLAWTAIESDIEELYNLNEDFENRIEKVYLNDISQEVLYEISSILRKIYLIFTRVEILEKMSAVIFELSLFLESLDFELLNNDVRNRLRILEFIYDDIARFINTVFIYQDTLDIHYLEDSLESSINQLKMNVLSQNIEEEELELF